MVTTYGAQLLSIRVPNSTGQMSNVVLGSGTLQMITLVDAPPVMGATIQQSGPNRSPVRAFHLRWQDRTKFPRTIMGMPLHGGTVGFDRRVWSCQDDCQTAWSCDAQFLPTNDLGFPGNLNVLVTFSLRQQHGAPALSIGYAAGADRVTVVSFTNHSYFTILRMIPRPRSSTISRALTASRCRP